MEIDYIIVGAGLAGISMGLELQQRGKKLLIVDSGLAITSSKIAAGIINPIVPKRVLKTWMCDEIFPLIEPFYQKWEVALNSHFFDSVPILQIHSTARESNEWAGQYEYLKEYIEPGKDKLPEHVYAPFGYSQTLKSGRLNVSEFCMAGIQFLGKTNAVYEKHFEYSNLSQNNNGGWVYEDYTAKSVIFCEGIQALENPFFSNLPFIPSGGDILELEIEGLANEKRILKQKHWLVPLSENKFLAGSNFHHHSLSTAPNPKDADEIITDIKKWVNTEIQLLNHKRAVRPTVKNRRPLLGESELHKGLYIFNGLGTKGSSLCPWLAPMMADFLCSGNRLHPEVDIANL